MKIIKNRPFHASSQSFAFGTLSALLLVLSLVGCTKKEAGTQTGASSQSSGQSGGVTVPPAAGENVLRFPMIADAKTLDPMLIDDLYSAIAASLVYDSLLQYHYLKRPHALEPLLADGMPVLSKDGKTFTFKIKKGVKFIDHEAFPGGKGREVKAKDFVYSFLRIADPKGASGAFWIFDGHIEGLNEWREKQKKATTTDFDTTPSGFKAVDDYTLQVKLKDKYPQLLFVLAMPQASVVAREVVEKVGKDFVNTPVGTGPYKLVSWLRNSKITFDRNPNWRGEKYPSEGETGDAAKGLLADAGKAIPFADKIELHVFTESQPNWLNFRNGNIDVSGIPKDNFKQAIDESTKELSQELAKQGISLSKAVEADLTYTAFNLEDPVIKKLGPNFRKAVALATDKKKVIELFRNGRAIPAQSPIPPGIAGYDPNYVNPFSEFNPTKAKEYLAKAGYPEGKGLPEIVYDTATGTDSRQMAELLQSELKAIGVNIRISVNQFSELTEKLNKKQAQMWGMGWIGDYPDAENFMQLLYGPNKAPSPNSANFDDPEFNKLYVQMRGMLDSPERHAVIKKMNKILEEQMPWVVDDHRIAFTVSHAWLHNLKAGYMGPSPLKFYRVDTERRQKGLSQ